MTNIALSEETPTELIPLSGGTCSELKPETSSNSKTADVAFVIGNGSYHPQIGWLENPANDASAFSAIALRLGFHVFAITEGTQAQINHCLERLHQKHRRIDKSIFYYSGHGLQENNKNFILPIDLKGSGDIGGNAIAVDPIISSLRKKSNLSIIFFDACRSNPVNGDNGLALTENVVGLQSNDSDTRNPQFVYMFATQPGNIAGEGAGKFSPFTEGLIQLFGREGKSLSENLVAVTSYVGQKTKWKQIPFVRSSLSDLVFLNKSFSLDDLKLRSDAFFARSEDALKKGDALKSLQYAIAAIPTNATDEQIAGIFPEVIPNLRNKSFAKASLLDAGDEPFRIAEFSSSNDRVITGNELPEYKHFAVKLWNLKNGELIWKHEFSRDVTFLNQAHTTEFSPDGKLFFVKTQAWKVDIRSSQDGSLVSEIPLVVANNSTYANKNDEPDILSASFSPSGEQIMLAFRQAAYGKTYTKKIYSTADGKEVALVSSWRVSDLNERGSISSLASSYLSDEELCFMAIVDRNNGSFTEPLDTMTYWGKRNLATGEIQVWHTAPGYFQSNGVQCSPYGDALWYKGFTKIEETEEWVPRTGVIKANGKALIVKGDSPHGMNSTVLFYPKETLLFAEGETGKLKGYNVETGNLILDFKRTNFEWLHQLHRKDGTIVWQGGPLPNARLAMSRLLSNAELIDLAKSKLGKEELRFVEENALVMQ